MAEAPIPEGGEAKEEGVECRVEGMGNVLILEAKVWYDYVCHCAGFLAVSSRLFLRS